MTRSKSEAHRYTFIPRAGVWLALVTLPLLALLTSPALLAGELDEAWLASKARLQLLQHLDVDSLDVEIDVKGEEVTLGGVVASREARELAAQIVRNMDEVQQVNNELTLSREAYDKKSMSGRALEDAEAAVSNQALQTRVRMRLLDEIGLDALALDIDAAEGTVVLGGELDTQKQHEVVLREARSVEGVREVEDQLKVARS